MHAPAAPLPPPIGTKITSIAGSLLEDLERRGRDARDQVGLVRPSGCTGSRARAASRSQCSRASSKSRPWTTTSAPSPRIDATFTGFAPSGTQIDRAHAEQPRRVGDRLAVVAVDAEMTPALALVGRELGDEVDAAAHLERADRLVVLVLDEHVRAEQLVERRVASRAASGAGTARCAGAPRARR